jgi:hypothetical protein
VKLYVITPAAGKRLIARAVAARPDVLATARRAAVVVIAGTTNGYVAEELLAALGSDERIPRRGFRRGVTVPPGYRPGDAGPFPGDLVIVNGQVRRGATIFDVADELAEGDIIVKGANALDLKRRRAAVLIGDPKGGTAMAAMQAVVGRRVRMLVPVGLEKRVASDLVELAAELDAPGSSGPRLLPLVGEVITEIEALAILTGASATLVASGGVGGAEGAVWLGVAGTDEQMGAADVILRAVGSEPPFEA